MTFTVRKKLFIRRRQQRFHLLKWLFMSIVVLGIVTTVDAAGCYSLCNDYRPKGTSANATFILNCNSNNSTDIKLKCIKACEACPHCTKLKANGTETKMSCPFGQSEGAASGRANRKFEDLSPEDQNAVGCICCVLIIVGVLAGCLIVGIIVYCCMKGKGNQPQFQQMSSAPQMAQGGYPQAYPMQQSMVTGETAQPVV